MEKPPSALVIANVGEKSAGTAMSEKGHSAALAVTDCSADRRKKTDALAQTGAAMVVAKTNTAAINNRP
jgi:hypothetical protein